MRRNVLFSFMLTEQDKAKVCHLASFSSGGLRRIMDLRKQAEDNQRVGGSRRTTLQMGRGRLTPNLPLSAALPRLMPDGNLELVSLSLELARSAALPRLMPDGNDSALLNLWLPEVRSATQADA